MQNIKEMTYNLKQVLSANIQGLDQTSKLHRMKETGKKFNLRMVRIIPWSQDKQINFLPALLLLTHHQKQQQQQTKNKQKKQPRILKSEFFLENWGRWTIKYLMYKIVLKIVRQIIQLFVSDCYVQHLSEWKWMHSGFYISPLFCTPLNVEKHYCTGAWFKQLLNCYCVGQGRHDLS